VNRLLVAILVAPLLSVVGATPVEAASVASHSPILNVERIGTSVQGRPIRAYELGDPDSKVKAVVLGAIHGDEHAGIRLVRLLKETHRIQDVDLWLVPTVNPDGAAHNRRQNAHGVDLNRNWPVKWARLPAPYYSGRRALSEPETRAFKRFLNRVDPRFVVSFHQPLHGVGRDRERPAFQRRLASGLHLPRKAFNCTGVCHGTMTEWFNRRHDGTAITVEFGYHVSRHYLRHVAVRGVVRAVLGRFVRPSA
jgi:murein peptide amidase A